MRTTVNLNNHLLQEAKRTALESDRTLGQIIEDALRLLLRRGSPASRGKKIKLPTFRGAGLQRGVDLDSTAALLALMDEEKRRDPARR